MRITDRYQTTIEKVAPTKPVATTSKAAATTATAESSSVLDVNVSAKAQELSSRAAGVDALKQQIANGSFKVDADAIAARLVGGDDE